MLKKRTEIILTVLVAGYILPRELVMSSPGASSNRIKHSFFLRAQASGKAIALIRHPIMQPWIAIILKVPFQSLGFWHTF